MILAAVLLIDLLGGLAYGLNNEFGVLLRNRAVAYVAAIVLCGAPLASGKGVIALVRSLLARRAGGDGEAAPAS